MLSILLQTLVRLFSYMNNNISYTERYGIYLRGELLNSMMTHCGCSRASELKDWLAYAIYLLSVLTVPTSPSVCVFPMQWMFVLFTSYSNNSEDDEGTIEDDFASNIIFNCNVIVILWRFTVISNSVEVQSSSRCATAYSRIVILFIIRLVIICMFHYLHCLCIL